MLQAGQQFAHFKVIRELGSGGMGAVYLAEDLKLHREVALKVILGDYFDDAERLQRFQREAKTAAQITHPNIMAIYDIGSAPHPETGRELEYIVMERVKGIPLGEYFQTNNPDMGGVIRIAGRIAAGLTAAHRLNIAHRDIKASNVLVDDEGNPKILDFGLAKPVETVQFGDGDSGDTVSQELTRAGRIVGTVSYMSPEQARGEAVDVRTDIFSFGVLLYRMATGEFPFSAQSQVSTLAKILEARHPAPHLKNHNIPGELERIIDKCLQKDPNDRYQSAADLAVDLRNLRRQFDSGVSDSVSGEFRTAKRKAPVRKNVLYAVGGVIGLSLVALLVLNLFDSKPSEAERSQAIADVNRENLGKVVAVFDFENKTGDPSLDWLTTGLPEILMTDLAQSSGLTVISRDRVLDHLRGSLNMAAVDDLSEDIRAEIQQAQEDMREALKDGSVEDIPGVKEALELARVGLAGSRHTYSHTDLVAAAAQLGASSVLSGAYFKLGDRIRIDARLEDIGTGKIVLAEKVVGDDPFTLVDSLTGKITASLDIRGRAEGQSIASVLTNSPEAYKFYHDGMDLFAVELYDEAIEQFQQALAIDSTFALAYMRLGMANVFEGRTQQGTRYFAKAKQHRDGLPVRERSLLDIYSDLWLDFQFDAAVVKLDSYVGNYPDDNEARAFCGLVAWIFEKDTVAVLAQYDTVLQNDPANPLALAWKGDILDQLQSFDSAVYYYKKLKSYHPESPAGYQNLASHYRDRGQAKEAAAEYQAMTELFPTLAGPYAQLADLSMRARDFDRAAGYLRQLRSVVGKDPYKLNNYHYRQANLAQWQGRFRDAFDHVYKALDYAIQSDDSGYVRNAFSTLNNYYERFEKMDSARWCIDNIARWQSGFGGGFDLALSYANLDPALCDSVRPEFNRAVSDFKQRTPSSFWPLAGAIEGIFDSYCASDTAGVINALLELNRVQQPGQGDANVRGAGVLMVLTGRYQEGRDILVRYLSGDDEVTSGFLYPQLLYYVGLAEQELGNLREARSRFEEVLRYWGNADIDFKDLRDTRKRLSELTS